MTLTGERFEMAMTDIIPLQIYPWPVSPELMEHIRRAKQSINLDAKVLPTEAVPGGPSRVLALGSLPPFVCDAALVKDPSDGAAIQRALNWLLTAPPMDKSGFMKEDYITSFFPDAVEVAPPKCKCASLEFGCNGDKAVRNGVVLKGHCADCYYAGCYLTEGLCLGPHRPIDPLG